MQKTPKGGCPFFTKHHDGTLGGADSRHLLKTYKEWSRGHHKLSEQERQTGPRIPSGAVTWALVLIKVANGLERAASTQKCD